MKSHAVTAHEHYDLVRAVANSRSHWSRITLATFRVHRIGFATTVVNALASQADKLRFMVGTEDVLRDTDHIVLGGLAPTLVSNAKMRLIARSHAKYVIFERPKEVRAILTTRNLGLGDWYEFSCLLNPDQALPLVALSRKMWHDATDVSKLVNTANNVAEVRELFRGLNIRRNPPSA